jgi:chromosome segregation ATPase
MNGDPFDPLMSRDLTPILTERTPSNVPMSVHAPLSPANVPSATRDDLRVLSYQLEVMQKKVHELENRRDGDARMEMLAARWEEFLSTAEYRFQKIQSQFQKQHELYKAHFRDLQSKIAVAMGWMKERNDADSTLYENIEEQRQAIQAFEGRMQQWQKIVSEQELQLLNEDSDKNRIEKMQAHLQRQFEVVQAAYREMQTAVAQLSTNVGRGAEQAINEVVERQRQMSQSFELRMGQVQKIISEQEIQLMNSRAELKDTLREISRLKGR